MFRNRFFMPLVWLNGDGWGRQRGEVRRRSVPARDRLLTRPWGDPTPHLHKHRDATLGQLNLLRGQLLGRVASRGRHERCSLPPTELQARCPRPTQASTRATTSHYDGNWAAATPGRPARCAAGKEL